MIKKTHYRYPLCGHYVTEAEFVAAGTARIYCEGAASGRFQRSSNSRLFTRPRGERGMLIAAMGKAGHGKSTFLKEVQGCMARLRGDYYPGDQRWICFKDPLIDCANKLGWQGVQDEKNRRFLQVLGTDLMRECVDKDYWVNLWRPRVEDALRMGLVVFCDDVRFPNEHAADRQIKSNAINYLSSK